MAVAHDADCVTPGTAGAAATSYNDTTLTIGSGGDALVAQISFLGVPTNLTATWNSHSMSLIGTKTASDNGSSVWLFGLLKGALGAGFTGNHTLAYAWTGSLKFSEGASSFSGSDQGSFATTFPAANVVIDASSPTANYGPFTITSLSGDFEIAMAVGSSQGWSSVSAPATVFVIDGGNDGCSGYNASVGATTSITFTGEFGAPGPSCAVAARIVAVGNVPVASVPLGILGFVENEF